jgi:hydroxymethylpyrimidine/phosphomethylpyrimidine kinase
MVATTGAKLLPSDAVRELRTKLLPQTTVLTPNIPEARLIMVEAGLEDRAVANVNDLEVIGRAILSLGPQWVLVKGGHCPFREDGVVATTDDEKKIVVDVLCGAGETVKVETPYQNSKDTHGTGCSLAC